jgi:predicted negative regulator of RcsB-dependent stress response
MSRPDGNPLMIPIMVVLILGLAGVMGYEAWSRSQKAHSVPASVSAPRKVAPAPSNQKVAPSPPPTNRKYEVFNG